MTNRQEVAEKIRKIGEYDCYETALYEIDTIIGTGNSPLFQDFLNRLADLIDPTCKVENAGEVPLAKESLTTWFCSECGSPIYNDMQPSYCIYCGARVVRDEA